MPRLILLVAAMVCQGDVRAAGKGDKIQARGRVVAIGDLHGDLAGARRAFRCAKVIDEDDRWIGGHSIVVQTGDLLDRATTSGPWSSGWIGSRSRPRPLVARSTASRATTRS